MGHPHMVGNKTTFILNFNLDVGTESFLFLKSSWGNMKVCMFVLTDQLFAKYISVAFAMLSP